MVWTRRRCPECGQMMVEDEGHTAPCPSCGVPVGPESAIPELSPEAESSSDTTASPDSYGDEPSELSPEDDAPSELPPEEEEPSEVPQDWNLGEPMHRVFWFCLSAPDRVPLATMFRSLRWVFAFAWIGQILIQGSGLLIGSALLDASSDEVDLLRDLSAATAKSNQAGPETKRLRRAQEQLCTMTMVSPEQRLLCALNPALAAMTKTGTEATRRVEAIERLRRPGQGQAWISIVGDGLIGIFLALFPLWGLLGLARHSQAWGLALRVTAFGQSPLVACAVIAAASMQFAGPIGLSIGIMTLVSGLLWSLALWVGFLVRIGSLAPRQAALTVLMILLFDMTLLTSLAGAA
jgi:hypothetical protein